ncbi:MAG: hypothetical protein HYX26_10310 [Acidobacteriales bacterium]|nr:hypothetical protein [Terriglobales bacterium]
MILLISQAKTAAQCATALQKFSGHRVQIARTLGEGVGLLRREEFAVVVADQLLLDSNPKGADLLWRNTGVAVPVEVNFALASAERIARDVRAAVDRREKEQLLAARAAEAILRGELTGTVSGILLNSEIALSQPQVPASVQDRIRSVHELAEQLRTRLAMTA